ncbi:acyltransferase family protein [Hyphobacterium marinum]|uniref:Acyltransferase n=1 Tax=Hyphobacterium marinum TaxID=3116574 RepID=A0ABU7LXU7_9PROT|nr:acyltransferase [Hyphobacterium sp. Y6023]MEE2566381.1 acyltransferase [Hyphobacterium sp. Y6023]
MRAPNWINALFSGPHGRLEDRRNSFTAIRIGFAFLVLYGHALMLPNGLPMTGDWPVFIDNSVQFALDGFFILSGYMIAASLMNRRNMLNYAASRVLRIFPGLIVAALLLWLVVGPLFTDLSWGAYFTHPDSLTFLARIIFQIEPQADLPGVFADHPLTDMNGPLWTIRYELLAYLAAGVLAVMGLFRNKWWILVLFAGAALLSDMEMVWPYDGIGSGTLFAAARFGGAFMTGAVFYAWRDRIPLAPGWAVVLILAAIGLQSTPASMISAQIAMAYVTLWAGFLAIPGKTGHAIRNVEDVSYGVYILHWPIGQMLLASFPDIAPHVLLLAMAPLALLAGWLLRVLIEIPALNAKSSIVAGLRRFRPQAAKPA